MPVTITAEQRNNPSIADWVAAKDKENAAESARMVKPTVSTGGTQPLVGPILTPNRPNVTVPTVNNAGNTTTIDPATGKTKTNIPGIQNGTLQGPYVNPDNGNIQAGANVVNGQIQYNQPTLPQQQQQTVPQMAQPNLYQDPYARSREEIAQLARDRIAKILQAGRTAAGGARTGAKNAYDYTNQIEGDSRTLRNSEFKNRNDPFSGQTSYQASQMLRNDSIQDTAQDKDYNAQVGLINQKLADLEAAAPGDEQAIIDQLEQIERQTGISVAQLQEQQKQNQFNQGFQQQQFNYNAGQDRIQNDRNAQNDAYAQDPNNPNNYGQSLTNQLNELKIGNYSTEVKQQAQLFEQEYKKGNLTNEALEYNLKQAKDPNSPTNLAAKMDLEMKKIDFKNYPKTVALELQKLQKTVADIGVVHRQPQTANEIEMDKVKLKTAQEQYDQLVSGKPAPNITVDDYAKKYLDGLAKYDSEGNVSNGPALESQILSSGKAEAEMRQMYARYNLKWG